MSKLYNDPLLRTSISLVASEDGKKSTGSTTANETNNAGHTKSQALSIAVSSALLLAFTVGIVQLVLYFSFAGSILKGMGVGSTSPMQHSAYSYLRVRALGTPAATLWLVTNGKSILSLFELLIIRLYQIMSDIKSLTAHIVSLTKVYFGVWAILVLHSSIVYYSLD